MKRNLADHRGNSIANKTRKYSLNYVVQQLFTSFFNFPIFLAIFFLAMQGSFCGSLYAEENVLRMSAGGRINTLDPAMADDLVSAYIAGATYDTFLQYDYLERPYKLLPSALARMPEQSEDLLEYKLTLRDDLYFQDVDCLANLPPAQRKASASDAIFSILRVADARVHSPGFWLIRGKIRGIDAFNESSSRAEKGDWSIYAKSCEGLELIDSNTFVIKLNKPDPRFLYCLAMPYLAIVSERAAKHHANDLSGNAVGSGPFKVLDWMRDYRIILGKNQEYREEFFPLAESVDDRDKKLPLLDKIECYLVKQALSGWLLFLQGNLDISALDKDNIDAVVGSDFALSPALQKFGIRLVRVPELQINYVGFNFQDPVLASNHLLRKAISLAYDTDKRIAHSGGALLRAQGPLPPGVPGRNPEFVNAWSKYDPVRAAELLAEAGYKDGIDPETGKPLEFDFDLGDTTPYYRQLAEFMADDMKQIGIKINPILNNKPRFFQKLKEGKTQIFRLSWIGDYPDAENFLQLFYGSNAGSCNRSSYCDSKFDEMFREILPMPDSPERTKKYEQMVEYICGQSPWIFESHPTSFRLLHGWLENYIPHDYACSQWKYLSINQAEKNELRRSFSPLKMEELNSGITR